MKEGPAVLALYPEYVEDANAYVSVAFADNAMGDSKAEAAALTQYEHAGGQSPDVLKQLATLEAAAGDNAGAIETLERINYIYPVKDEDLHHRLGDLLYAQKNYDGAITEFNALAASNPVDKAGAQFELAQAYYAAGRKDKAQDSVLAALGIAPDYRPAQKLLLQIRESSAEIELRKRGNGDTCRIEPGSSIAGAWSAFMPCARRSSTRCGRLSLGRKKCSIKS